MRSRLTDWIVATLRAALVFACAQGAQAQVSHLVVPNAYATVEASGQTTIPFDSTQTSHRYQQVYLASEFAVWTEPTPITALAFRPDLPSGSAFEKTLADVQIELSVTSRTPATLAEAFDANVGTMPIVVVSRGPLSLSSQYTGSGEDPRDFDIVIPFDGAFVYDPSAGNLLLDVRLFDQGGTLPTQARFDRALEATVVNRMFCFADCSVDDVTGSLQSPGGLVTRFTAPEPASGVEAAAILAPLAWLRRRKALSARQTTAPRSLLIGKC